MPKLLSSYAGPTFPDPQHPGYGKKYLILNSETGGPFSFSDDINGDNHAVTFCIPWEGLAAFRQFVIQGSSSTTSGGVTTVTRTLPLQTPFPTIFPNTYAQRLSGKGSGSDANVSDSRLFADLILTVEFGTLNYNPEGAEAWLEINYGGSANYDTIPGANLAFSNGEKIEHDAGVIVGQVEVQVTVHNIPDMGAFLSNVIPLKGKASSAIVTLDGFAYPAGTLLFPTFDGSKATDSLGVTKTTATVRLTQRDIPWNSGIRSDAVVDSISPPPYSTTDLNTIFT